MSAAPADRLIYQLDGPRLVYDDGMTPTSRSTAKPAPAKARQIRSSTDEVHVGPADDRGATIWRVGPDPVDVDRLPPGVADRLVAVGKAVEA